MLVRVLFDQPIEPGVLDVTNWFLRQTSSEFLFGTATAADSTVTLTVVGTTANFGSDTCDYAASPADVVGLNALAALAQVGIPII